MVNKKFSVGFFIDPRKNKNGYFPIYIRLLYDRKKVAMKLPFTVSKDDWNAEKERSLTDDGLNEELLHLENQVQTIKRDMIFAGKEPDIHKIIAILKGKDGKEMTIAQMMDRTIKAMRENPRYSPLTIKGYQTRYKLIARFLENEKTPNLKVLRVDVNTLHRFETFLQKQTSAQFRRPLSRSHMNKTHKVLSTLLNQAVREGAIKSNPYRQYPPLPSEAETIKYLTESEIKAIREMDLSQYPNLVPIRDWFLFGCMTGLRVSDLKDLRLCEINKYEEGGKERYMIERIQIKTKRPVRVPLFKWAVDIYHDYKDTTEAKSSGKLFPKIQEQYVNRQLKIIASLCGIPKGIYMHMARHTCGTFLLSNGVPIEQVSEVLGHTDIRMTMKYAKILKTTLNRVRDTIDNALSSI